MEWGEVLEEAERLDRIFWDVIAESKLHEFHEHLAALRSPDLPINRQRAALAAVSTWLVSVVKDLETPEIYAALSIIVKSKRHPSDWRQEIDWAIADLAHSDTASPKTITVLEGLLGKSTP